MLSIQSIQWLKGFLYLDPGSGSFLLQLLIGVLMGAGLAIKIYWGRIVAFFKKQDPKTSVNSSSENDEE